MEGVGFTRPLFHGEGKRESSGSLNHHALYRISEVAISRLPSMDGSGRAINNAKIGSTDDCRASLFFN